MPRNKHTDIFSINDAAIAVKTAIDGNPLSRANLKKLIPEIQVSRNNLLPAFRKLTGKSIKRYRLEKRMQVAGILLAENKLTVKEVAIECGYAGMPGSFSRYFKSVHKITPEEWRLKCQNKDIEDRTINSLQF